ncbi:hypothetical protein MTY59_11600 [Mycobacterium senriense]|uniref:Uncharacterized protein n=1 Tax=Mycobacterium senriense TaxID=2775496 RepID=A0ABM7SMP2_9MYCO|nr:hypothetical protein MTY59_11600 [Mycobacterium senriense]
MAGLAQTVAQPAGVGPQVYDGQRSDATHTGHVRGIVAGKSDSDGMTCRFPTGWLIRQ